MLPEMWNCPYGARNALHMTCALCIRRVRISIERRRSLGDTFHPVFVSAAANASFPVYAEDLSGPESCVSNYTAESASNRVSLLLLLLGVLLMVISCPTTCPAAGLRRPLRCSRPRHGSTRSTSSEGAPIFLFPFYARASHLRARQRGEHVCDALVTVFHSAGRSLRGTLRAACSTRALCSIARGSASESTARRALGPLRASRGIRRSLMLLQSLPTQPVGEISFSRFRCICSTLTFREASRSRRATRWRRAIRGLLWTPTAVASVSVRAGQTSITLITLWGTKAPLSRDHLRRYLLRHPVPGARHGLCKPRSAGERP